MQSVDVAIVGGGMVGLAVACGLQGSGLRVAVLEQRVPEPLAADAPPQLRVFGYPMPPAKNYSPVLASGRTFSLVGPVVITVWKCGTKTVLVTFRLTIKAWAIAILGISLKTQ
ncbi:putative monooxygenase [Escherichia coli]|uniref:Putative monooxygenase n=1 Tax=Escherichia coli TaxID=562 RepID=A0A377C242_ECOLX|nr:putative monooxygenase [Escherichia coli]